MIATALLTAAFVALSGTPTPDAPPAGDLSKLQGRWTAMAGAKGKVAVVLEIQGTHVDVRIKTPTGLELSAEGAVKLDEEASPKALDWVEFTAPDGQDLPTVLGIYEFDGETLRICNGSLNDARPDAFRPGESPLASVVVFRRPAEAAAALAEPVAPVAATVGSR